MASLLLANAGQFRSRPVLRHFSVQHRHLVRKGCRLSLYWSRIFFLFLYFFFSIGSISVSLGLSYEYLLYLGLGSLLSIELG